MSEEPATPDPLELSTAAFAAAAGHDLDALTAFYARVEHRRGWVTQWADGLVVRVTVYLDVDAARAAAERLAAERGWAVPQEHVIAEIRRGR